jgi:hypothetical protein
MKLALLYFNIAFLALSSCGTSSSNSNIDTLESTSIENVPMTNSIDFWKDYSILSAEYGTKTTVVIKDGMRLMTTNALPNHEVGTFPNPGNPNTISAQNRSYAFPIHPKLTGESRWAREPGVALNGVKFEPETAERFVCETGEVYRVEAFQNVVDFGLDHNHAHVQPTGAYHYHGVPVELVKKLDKGEDIIHVGFAKDGFPICYSKSGQFKPSYQLATKSRTGDACSYNNPSQKMTKELQGTNPDGTFVSDWDYVEGLGQLDECNGITINGQYTYFLTDTYPYMSRCLKGEFTEEHGKGPPPSEHSHRSAPNGGRPNGGDHPHQH